MRFRFGDCCCISGILMSGGPWDWYRDYFVGASGIETINTPHIPRTASIYTGVEDPLINPVPAYYDSYSGWYVDVPNSDDGTNFQNKYVLYSISPLGVNSSEIVYLYLTNSSLGLLSNVKMDCVNKTIDWIQMPSEWTDPEKPMGPISIGYNAFALLSSNFIPGNFESHGFNSAGYSANNAGLLRWEVAQDPSVIIDFVDIGSREGAISRKWTLSINGNDSFEEHEFFEDWLNANGGDIDEFTEYTYFLFGLPYYSDLSNNWYKRGFNTYHFPVGQAPQGNYAIGIRYPHIDSLPDSYSSEFSPYGIYDGTTFVPQATVNIGPFQIDANGFPYVAGDTIWSFSEDIEYRFGDRNDFPIGGLWAAMTRVDGFDAATINSQTKSIAIITYYYTESYVEDGGLYYSDVQNVKSNLVVNGGVVGSFHVYRVIDLINSTFDGPFLFSTDNRDFYPYWVHPRCLHTTESSQGGGSKTIIFQRIPRDRDSADSEWAGNSTPGNWKLIIFHEGDRRWSIDSNWGRSVQAVGTVTFTTDNFATITLSAIPGGTADGDWFRHFDQPDELVTLTVIFDDRVIEDAVFDRDNKTLTVYINIAGGNDTIQDVIDIIIAAGDFAVTGYTNESDIIIETDTGTGEFINGSDNPSGSADFNKPYVHDSSDRYFYVNNFPLRKRYLIDNRWTCLFNIGTQAYPSKWMISHDGEIFNNVGLGIDRTNRQEYTSALGDWSFGCIKNSNLIPLCPIKEEY